MKTQWIAVLAVLAFAGCSHAKVSTTAADTAAPQVSKTATTTAKAEKVSCTRGKDTRFLEIVKKGPGCALDYNKGGKMSVVATARHGAKHCTDAETKIETKLKTAGYKCM